MATALTQAEWFARLKGWVPGWVFEKDQNAKAYFEALALTLSQAETIFVEHLAETFLEGATGDILDLHGSERNVSRILNELDPTYRVRIRQIVNNANCPALKQLVDDLLINGESIIVEDYNAQVFANRENFIGRNTLLLSEIIKDAFSVLVPKQIHAPYSFLDRENFVDRADFYGRYTSSEEVFQAILAAVNAAKAAGCLYRIIELAEE